MAAAFGAFLGLVAAPYAAGLTLSIPDRADRHWYRPQRMVGAGRLVVCLVLGAVLGGLAAAAVGWTAGLPAFLLLGLVATPLVVIDIEHHRLPDRLVVAAGLGGAVLFAAAAAWQHDWAPLARVVVSCAVLFSAFLAVALSSPSSLGFGDVKLAAVLGGYLGWLGWGYLLPGLFAGFLLGALVALALLVIRRVSLTSQFAFGPALVVGALASAALSTGL